MFYLVVCIDSRHTRAPPQTTMLDDDDNGLMIASKVVEEEIFLNLFSSFLHKYT